MPDSTLHLAIAFSLIQIAAILTIALYLIGQRSCTRFYRNICDQLRPALQEHVTALAYSGQAWPSAIPKHGPARRVLEECLSVSLAGLRDSGRDRVAQFAWEQGFAKQWQQAFSARGLAERKRALSLLASVAKAECDVLLRQALIDPDADIRTEAARALLARADPETVDRIFRVTLTESLLTRVLLTADLKRHARHLFATTIPAVLAEGRSLEISHCLEILNAWKLAIPSFDIEPLLSPPSQRHVNMPLVVGLLPYVPVPDTVADYLGAALATSDVEVQCAAAQTAGLLRLSALIAPLQQLLSHNPRLAGASAKALAQMGPEGEGHLHTAVSGPDRKAAAAAMEALETLALGRQ